MKTAVIQLTEAHAARLLQLGKVRIGWVACRIRENAETARCFWCLSYGHGNRGCGNPDRKNTCWRCGTTGHLARSCKAPPRCLTCLDRGDKEIAHVSGGGSYPVFREELWRLRDRNWSSCSSTSEGERITRTFWCRLPGRSTRAGILVCSPDLSAGDFLKSDAGFVWVEVAGVRAYSCYFSPNDPFEVFETQILLLEESLSEAVGRPLIGGDFNSKSPGWGEARLDSSGNLGWRDGR